MEKGSKQTVKGLLSCCEKKVGVSEGQAVYRVLLGLRMGACQCAGCLMYTRSTHQLRL